MHLLLPPRWTRLADVTVGGPQRQTADVVVGPSGVHVVIRQASAGGATARLRVREATAAAAAVRATLPARYRDVVAAVVQLEGAGEDGGVVDGVTVATANVLAEALRCRPRVLSTSEAAGVAGRLRVALEASSPPPARRERRWPRPARRRVLKAA
ncbi:MAG TPA: hypothetical protein VFX52_04560 [Nocardioidaceae bacterium]|nr:hypothetical protein [Nocardioidaceae bacterium]